MSNESDTYSEEVLNDIATQDSMIDNIVEEMEQLMQDTSLIEKAIANKIQTARKFVKTLVVVCKARGDLVKGVLKAYDNVKKQNIEVEQRYDDLCQRYIHGWVC